MMPWLFLPDWTIASRVGSRRTRVGSTRGQAGSQEEMRDFYGPSASAVVRVDVPTMNFLMIDGRGDPNSSTDYADAVQALSRCRTR